MIFQGYIEFVGEGVDDGSSDAKASKRTWAGHKGNLADILPGLMFC